MEDFQKLLYARSTFRFFICHSDPKIHSKSRQSLVQALTTFQSASPDDIMLLGHMDYRTNYTITFEEWTYGGSGWTISMPATTVKM
jgi:hypothetical protein